MFKKLIKTAIIPTLMLITLVTVTYANPEEIILGTYSEDGRWRLAWSDEFEGGEGPGYHNGLDLSTWEIQTGNGVAMGIPGWGNGEIQYYHYDNVWVEDGMLHIEARLEERGSAAEGFWRHTSGRIRSVGTEGFREAFGHGKSVLYGRIEARISLPKGDGLWPAFWMMPTYDVYGTWAASGEIDIMEARGREPHVSTAAIHYGGMWPHNTHSSAYLDLRKLDPNLTINDFILYSVEWEPGEMRFLINDYVFWTVNDWHALVPGKEDLGTQFMWPAPFDQYFHLILNLAIGGWFDGGIEPDDNIFDNPIIKKVDYVRIWEYTGEFAEPTPPTIAPDPIPDDVRPETYPGGLIRDIHFNNIIRYAPLPGHSSFPTRDGWELFAGDFGGRIDNFSQIDGGINIGIGLAGDPVHANQLMQRVPLVRGRHYRLSFDAYAKAPRSMNVRLSQGANPGWIAYSDFTPQLTTSIQHFTHYFTMTETTNLDARLEFNMGGNNHDIWIGNVRLIEIPYLPEVRDIPKLPLPDGNMIWNGSFDQGENGFIFWGRHKGADSLYINRMRRQLEVNNAGQNSRADDIKITQSRIPFANDTFKLTFDAKGEGQIGFRVVSGEDKRVLYYSTLNIETTFKTQQLTFTLEDVVSDSREATVEFLFGESNNTIFDNVRLERLTFYDRDFTMIVQHPLRNGDFFDGLNFWTEVSTSGGLISTAYENQVAVANVSSLGSQPWSAMLMNEGLQVHSGFTYVVSFDVSANTPRNIQLVVETSAFTRRLESIINVTEETTNHRFEFNSINTETLDLKFLMGAMEGANIGNVYISNVKFYVLGAPDLRIPTLRLSSLQPLLNQNLLLAYNQEGEGSFSESVIEIRVNGQEAKFSHNPGEIMLDASNFARATTYRIEILATGFEAVTLFVSLDYQMDICESSKHGFLLNGDFSCPLMGPQAGWWHPDGMAILDAPWLAWVNATHEYISNGIRIDMAAPGYQPWHIQLHQQLPTQLPTGEYVLEFQARSNALRNIIVEFGAGSLQQWEIINLTAGWQTFRIYRPTAAYVRFMLGGGELAGIYAGLAHYVEIRNTSLNEVKDNIDICESSQYGFLLNGDFSCPLTGQEAGWWHPDGMAVFSPGWLGWINAVHRYVEEGLAIDLAAGGFLPWHVQLNQTLQSSLINGDYELIFTARSTEPRYITVEFGSGALQQHERIFLTEEWIEFRIERSNVAHIRFLLGGGEEHAIYAGSHHSIYFKEIILREVIEEEYLPVLQNVTAKAFLKQIPGNQNQLIVTITKYFSNNTTKEITESFMVRNNSDVMLSIANTDIFVSIRGNTQIREIFVIENQEDNTG